MSPPDQAADWMIPVIAGSLAVILLVLVLQDAFEVMLLPRRVNRRLRFTRLYFSVSWAFWSGVGARVRDGTRRESFLGVFGALSMVVLFALWATALVCSFGVLQWALRPASEASSSLGEQLYMSGVTFFTLGFGDVVPHGGPGRVTAVVEAGTGIGFIAVVIGYLPVLYQLFARREAHVIQLDARAGSPPTATTLLCRHAEAGGLARLDEFLREWEIWGSDLLESHLSYPMLVYYRSQHDNQSWLAAMAAVMDCCALILVGVTDLPPLQARMTFAMARQVVVEMARSFGVAPSRYDGGDRLETADYLRMETIFAESGLNWQGGPGGQETLAALRATYEPLLDGLSSALLLPIPGWIAADDASDHWQGGHRGLIASRLIALLADHDAKDAVAPDDGGRMAQRLRARLNRP
jgi:hypothetical protein